MIEVPVEHQLDFGKTKGGKRYAVCVCGWRRPPRPKLTHVVSDYRDHAAEIKIDARNRGWAFSVQGLVVTVVELREVVEMPDTPAPALAREPAEL